MSRLSAPGYVERCARRLLDARKEDEDDCRSISPRTLAAAAVHTAFDVTECDDRPPLAAVSDVLDVSVSTISERKNDLVNYHEACK
jgi:transcription initiation factor TFIIIB Brf1 subunit/transcription initiation factor TFIIB